MMQKKGSAKQSSAGLFFPKGKKGIAMSIGMIVTLILSIVIFITAVYLLFEWFGEAEELKAEIDRQTSEQIQRALKIGNKLVAIPVSIKQAKRGGSVTFGIGVRNVQSTKDFSMAVGFSGAYDPGGQLIYVDEDFVEEKWLGQFKTTNTFTLKKNEQKLLPQLIKVDTNIAPGKPTTKGDYTFNVCIYDTPLRADGSLQYACSVGQYGRTPDAFYTGKLYQVVVKVI